MTPASSSAAPPAPSLADAGAHPHAMFQYYGMLYGRLVVMGREEKAMELLWTMAGYVRAHDEGDWFNDNWKRLSERIRKAGGASATGMLGMTREEVRARRYRLIIEGARRCHILENGQAHATARTLEEKRRRLAPTNATTRPDPLENPHAQ